ncbi:MAG: M48 family metallopeptidase [Verrucomicrobiota bacterium]
METVSHSRYRASAFPPDSKGQMLAGELSVTPENIEFISTSTSLSIPVNGIRIYRGGHNNQQIFFEHDILPGWTFVSTDSGVYGDPVLLADPARGAVLNQARKVEKRIPFPVLVGISLGVLLLVGLIILFLARDRIIEAIANRIPMQWEQSFGDKIFEQIKAEGNIVEKSPWETQVKEITSRLLPAAESSGYNFRFHISSDTNVNAFALPGGNVVIMQGLLENAETEEQIAGVLAHEMAHVTRRHSLRSIIQTAGLGVAIQMLFGDASGLVAVVGQGSQFLLQQKFSRNFEREADDVGWSYLVQAKIDPRGMIQFFERLQGIQNASQAGASMNGSLALLSTHPATQERIDRLNKKWEVETSHSNFIPLPPLRKPE